MIPSVGSVDVLELARQIAMRMDPDALLDSADVAAMLKCEPRMVTIEWCKAPGFPPAYRLKRHSGGHGQPRWKRREVQAWIDSHQELPAPKRGRRRLPAD